MGKQYRTNALAAVHETALGLAEAGVIDKRTMKAFDEMCLTPVKTLTPEEIRQIRIREKTTMTKLRCAHDRCFYGDPCPLCEVKPPSNILDRARKEFVCLEDGFLYYWPSGSGAIAPHELRIIADELDRLNKTWSDIIKEEFKNV